MCGNTLSLRDLYVTMFMTFALGNYNIHFAVCHNRKVGRHKFNKAIFF